MRTQTATLAAAAKAHDRQAAVSVLVSDEPCERPRLVWSEAYTESTKDVVHAACVTPEGTILRARVDLSNYHVCRQRITDPSSAAQWASWSDSGEYVSNLQNGYLDVWCDASNGYCYQAWNTGGNGSGFVWSYSTDDGQTWSAGAIVHDYGYPYGMHGIAGVAAGGVCWIAAICYAGPLGDYVELFQGNGTTMPTSVATSAATLSLAEWLGMARDAAGKLTVWFTAEDPVGMSFGAVVAQPAVYSVEWTSGGGFGAYSIMRTAGVGGPISFGATRLECVEVESGVYRYFGSFVEESSAPSYKRAVVCITPQAGWITEEVPWRYACSFGVEVLAVGSVWYLVQSDRAYRATKFNPMLQVGARASFDESRVRSVVQTERANEPGGAVIVLDNSDGYLDGAGSGVVSCVRPGSQVALAVGYQTSAGRELVYRQPLWIERVEHGRDGRKRVVTLECRDAWGELSALRVRRDLQLAGVEVGVAMKRAYWRVCASDPWAAASGPTRISLGYWRATAGERWSSQLAKLARAGGQLVRFWNASANGVGWSACATSWATYGAGSSAWTIGGASGSPFYQGRWWRSSQPFTAAQVEGETGAGAALLGESREWPAVWSEWRDVVAIVSDRRLDSQQDVDDRATAEGAFLFGGESGGVVRVGLVPGLEVGDVVTVTDELAGVSGAERYVRGVVTRVELAKGIAEQDLALEGVSS